MTSMGIFFRRLTLGSRLWRRDVEDAVPYEMPGAVEVYYGII